VPDAAAAQAIEDELRDRFGQLPWQAQNLIYVAHLRVLAARAGIRSIVNDGQKIVLQLHDEIGGARGALQRRLERGVEAGHSQIRLDVEALSGGWQLPLMRTVEALSDFRDQVVAELAAAHTD
jgi:transcription-repair coupling factor (superfamily II helicase)